MPSATHETEPTAHLQATLRQRRSLKLALLLASVVFSVAAFLALDWFRSAAIRRAAVAGGKTVNCRTSDPVRHHAYKPNCSFRDQWGKDWYDFSTNSLGLRDEKIRQVPLSDDRSRIVMLGDSFTEGQLPWSESYVGRVAARFPQYDILNGGVGSYSPSNYYNVARILLAAGVEFDEAIVFIDTADVADEASFYRDVDSSGAVAGPQHTLLKMPWYAKWRLLITKNLLLTNRILETFEHYLIGHGYYHVTRTPLVNNVFDMEGAAWPYRRVDEIDPYPSGYAPLGVEGGITREKAKMTLLWQGLEKRNIPISVVVYPYPGQFIHDTADSRQVRIWREWCEGKCKRFISLFPAFFAVKDQCPQTQPGCWYLNLFIFGDYHYNAAGNALVADAVIKSLTEQPPRKLARPSTAGNPGVLQ
jgi:hypothetical protein